MAVLSFSTLLGRTNPLGLRVVSLQACASWILPFDTLLVFGHLQYSCWDLTDLFGNKDLRLFFSLFLKSSRIQFLSPIENFSNPLNGLLVSYSSFVYLLHLI